MTNDGAARPGALAGLHIVELSDGKRDPHVAPHGIFRAAGDDRWVAIAVRDDDEWRRLATILGGDAEASDFATLAGRKSHEDALEQIVGRWTATRAPEKIVAWLQAAGIPSFTAMTNRDLHDDPHLAARGFFVELEHAEVGRRRHLGIPWRMSQTPCAVARSAPCLGEGTDYALAELLGYGTERVPELRACGVVA